MKSAEPRFLLMTDVISDESCESSGTWKFVLQRVGGSERLEASDSESGCSQDRLHLLAVVRGLEELDQPSHVKLITPSRYVVSALRGSLDQWRDNDWQWECFDEMTPVKYADLWQRVDRAREFHQIECRVWRVNFDEPAAPVVARPRKSPVVQLPNWAGWEWTQRFGYPVAVPAGCSPG